MAIGFSAGCEANMLGMISLMGGVKELPCAADNFIGAARVRLRCLTIDSKAVGNEAHVWKLGGLRSI